MEVYICLVLLAAAVGYAFAPRIATNTAKLVDEAPVVLDGLATGDIATQLATEFGWSEATKFRFKTFLVRHRGGIQDLAGSVDGFLVDAAHVIGYVLLIPILAIFFLRDGDYIAKTFIQALFPADRVAQALTAAHELHIVFAKYISAQVLLCILSFAFYFGEFARSSLSARGCLGSVGRISRVHSGRRMADQLRRRCQRRYCEPFALGLDHGPFRVVESASGLSLVPPHHGAAPSDSSTRSHFRNPSGSRGWRDHRHLHGDSSDGLNASDLADVRGAGINGGRQSSPSGRQNRIALLADSPPRSLCRIDSGACGSRLTRPSRLWTSERLSSDGNVRELAKLDRPQHRSLG